MMTVVDVVVMTLKDMVTGCACTLGPQKLTLLRHTLRRMFYYMDFIK